METLQITVDELLLIAGVIMMCAALAFAFSTDDSISSGCAYAYLGLGALYKSGYISVQANVLLFWAVAVLIVLLIRWMGVKPIKVPRMGRRYILIGSLAGMMVGVAASGVASMSIGAIVGAMLGASAFWRTAIGAKFGRTKWRATLETGLPTVVVTSQIGLALNALF